ncbi:hypothetical protein [Variovorax sp. JS1663]|uniref:hypothetical protein n=1 Tax=Variovorax sp. JS1663 TaxID=1851577 RepID=UPI000B346F09|nr:hypothetical protein [Variovorax sp. JS1663]OUM00214.1 hypothetical protein A8M77_22075 [Variovorax sp. JS1663]
MLSILTGCASVTHGTTQAIKIETLTPAGRVIEGAECRLANDKSEAMTLSGQSVPVKRSGGNLSIHCTHDGQAPAGGQAVSRVNGGMVGNIILGGLIGVAVDASNGSGFNYPSWMQLVFGEQRYFDRSAQQGDQALAGVKLGTTEVAAAAPTPATVPRKDAEREAERVAAPAVAAAPVAPAAAPEPVPVARASAAPTAASPASPVRVSLDDLNALLPAKP